MTGWGHGERRAVLPPIPALDGLRGLAVAAVVCFHAGFGWARGGWLGVSLFFTLSGYLITTLLLLEHRRSGRVSLRAFWSRRARRLLPAAWCALGLVVAIGVAGGWDASQTSALPGDVLAALLDVANWRFLTGGDGYAAAFAAPSPLQHFWSLAIEEQFYLVWPVACAGLLVLARGRRSVLLASVGALVGASVVLTIAFGSDVTRVYFGTDTRAAELLVGAGLACALAGRTRLADRPGRVVAAAGTVALVPLALLWTRADETGPWLGRGGLLLHAVLGALVLLAALQPGPLARALAVAPLVALGRISYGVYLFHWPVFLWLDGRRTGLGEAPLFALRVAVTLALALASFWLLEQPIRFPRRAWSRAGRPLVLAGGAAALSVLAVAATALPQPATPPLSANRIPEAARARVAASSLAPAALRVAVLGDSVATGLAAGLWRWADPATLEVVDATGNGCGTDDDATARFLLAEQRPSAACRARFETLRRTAPDVVVVHHVLRDLADTRQGDGWSHVGQAAHDDWLRAGLRRLADGIEAVGARPLWLLPARFGTPRLGGEIVPDAAARVGRLRQLVSEVAAERGITVLDLQPLVDSWASDERDDGVHYSPGETDRIGAWLGPQLLALPIARDRVVHAAPTRRLLVIGGDGAAALVPALRAAAPPELVVVDAALPGCRVRPAPCDSPLRYWPQLVVNARPDVVVVVPEPADWDDPFGAPFDPAAPGAYLQALFAELGAIQRGLAAPGALQLWTVPPVTDAARAAFVEPILRHGLAETAGLAAVDVPPGAPATDAAATVLAAAGVRA